MKYKMKKMKLGKAVKPGNTKFGMKYNHALKGSIKPKMIYKKK